MNHDEIHKQFEGKKITLMGLGLLGRGIGDARFFANAGASLIITDLKTAEMLAPAMEQLKDFPAITFHLGEHKLEDFEDRDLIIRAPNAPLDSPFLAHAREHNIPIEMDASLFAKLCAAHLPNVTIVGITGTRGKTTTTHLIYEMARAAVHSAEPQSPEKSSSPNPTTKNPNIKQIWLGGNERDTATLPIIETLGPNDTVVLELDSWQLQGFAESKLSPHVSVWTNFMRDHMNYYQGDMERYFEDKAAIARFQKSGDFFVAPRAIKEKIESRFGTLMSTWVNPFAELTEWEMSLPGEHNRGNAASAVAAARCLGIDEDVIAQVLKTFSPLPNRLEPLGEKNGIAFYNDSNATTPDATIAALHALAPQKRPIVLIAGGSDKALEFDELAKEMAAIKKLILFTGDATEKLKLLLPKTITPVMASTMNEAVDAALANAQSGDIILLSPGATSFGLFKNEYDRGDQFRLAFTNKKS